MLVVRISITCLGSVPHDGVCILGILTDEGTTARGSDHLVAIEGEDTELAKGTKYLTIEL